MKTTLWCPTCERTLSDRESLAFAVGSEFSVYLDADGSMSNTWEDGTKGVPVETEIEWDSAYCAQCGNDIEFKGGM